MLLDRTHSRWALLSGLTLTIGATAWFICHAASPNGLSGGSVPGLLFGIIGTLMMFFAGLLGARRPLRHRRIGSASFWLKGHLWLGTLCIPFILFHASFSLGGLLEQVLWFCLAFVAASGFFGLAVQQFLPRLLWKNVPLESFEPQSPWLCDRMTLTADIRISTACDRSLPEISEQLRQSARRLVQAFDQIVAGSESRSEKNARKLLMMQQLTPIEHRDYFWSMAKLAKSDLKAITFEGDFADLLAKIYENLRELPPVTAAATSTNAGTKPEPGPVVISHPRTTTPPQPAASAPTQQKATDKALVAATSNTAQTPAEHTPANTQPAAPAAPQTKLSPLELMKQKAAEKAAAAAAAANSTAQTPAEPAAETTQPAAPVAPPTKLSPLELMKQKAAEKAAAAAAAANSTAQTPAEPTAETTQPAATVAPPTKLSPLELMKQKAAEKAAAAAAAANSTAHTPAEPAAETTQPAAPAAPPTKLSPLELMKQKAAEKAAAAAAAANSTAQTPAEPAAETTQPAAPTAPTAPPTKLSPLELMKQKAAEKAAAAAAAANSTAQTPAEPTAETTHPAAPAAPPTKLSPLELMKQKAAEKAAAAAAAASNTAQTLAEPTAATTQPAATAAPPTKLSPLELMKQKAAEKAASATAANNPAQAAGEPAPPSTTASTPKPAVVKEPPQPPVKPPLPPRPTPTPAPGPASAPPTTRPASAAPSPEDRQLLWQFYTQLVRPFISNSRSVASVRQSPLANEIDAGRRFREIQMSLPATLHDLLRELQESCNTRRQIEQQRTLLRWMHWWLALHIPVSLLLIVFTLAHIVMALRVVPFRF